MQRSEPPTPPSPTARTPPPPLARARDAAADAVALAREQPAGEARLGRACLRLAGACYQLFDYAGCYSAALEAADLLGRGGEAELRARAVNFCFIVSIETGEFARALDHVRRALADARLDVNQATQAGLLINQAVVFDLMQEYDAAVRCLEEAQAALAAAGAGSAAQLFFARVNLADVHLGEAERRVAEGDATAAQALRERAARALPPFEPDARSAAVNTWVAVAARLGRIDEARRAALAGLCRVRTSPDAQRARAYALLALGELHVQAGRPDKGAHRLERAIERLRRAANRSHLGPTEARLARLHAERGDYASALHWQRRADEDGRALQAERHGLHWRLAALERDFEAQRARRDELALHAQRLAVVGRLLSEIYHALAGPIHSTRRTLASCVERLDGGSGVGEALPHLSRVIEQIDEASALARQLKIFSYRAQPQAMEVALASAVRDAWRGVALWRRNGAPSVDVVGDQSAVVLVDAQRLAVLLRILMIEAERSAAANTLEARIERLDAGISLLLCCRRHGARSAGGRSVGITLCAEIAQEMSGQLLVAASHPERLCFELRLPMAQAPEGF